MRSQHRSIPVIPKGGLLSARSEGAVPGDMSHLTLAPVDLPSPRDTVAVMSTAPELGAKVAEALDMRRSQKVDLLHVQPGESLDQLLAPGLTAVIAEIDPAEGGLARLKRLCAIGPNAPVVVLMRGMDDDTMLAAIEAGAEEVVDITPAGTFNGADLANAVARALARHSQDGRPARPVGRDASAPWGSLGPCPPIPDAPTGAPTCAWWRCCSRSGSWCPSGPGSSVTGPWTPGPCRGHASPWASGSPSKDRSWCSWG